MLLEVTSWKAKVAKAARSKAKVTKVELGIFLMNQRDPGQLVGKDLEALIQPPNSA